MWIKPVTGTRQHFMRKPRDENLAMRHSMCGRTFLIGLSDRAEGKRCGTCERLAPRHPEVHSK